ncbi:hypothetical protein EHP00_285 [Ecytonucleospora hepatopenaei]|uniref:Uncharacterized protein n=1 Tax=Ecytonucleospora hepatopenaei TaxID=646526 RepID=A0A1W0E7C3_9MICR|nr:hypothetical protein EHP00_285 [Ecytonucleospora hepatopenaei]
MFIFESIKINKDRINAFPQVTNICSLIGMLLYKLHLIYGNAVRQANVVGGCTFLYLDILLNIAVYVNTKYLNHQSFKKVSFINIGLMFVIFLLHEIGIYAMHAYVCSQMWCMFLSLFHLILFGMTQQFVILKMFKPQYSFVKTCFYMNSFFEGFVAYLCFKINGEYTSGFVSCQYETFVMNLIVIVTMIYSKKFRNTFSGLETVNRFVIGAFEIFLINLSIFIKSCVLYISAFFNTYKISVFIYKRIWNDFLLFFYLLFFTFSFAGLHYDWNKNTTISGNKKTIINKNVFYMCFFNLCPLIFTDVYSVYSDTRSSLSIWGISVFFHCFLLVIYTVKIKNRPILDTGKRNVIFSLYGILGLYFISVMAFYMSGFKKYGVLVQYY